MHALNQRLEQLYREHRQSLFTCALAITRNVSWAEDAVHEAFIRLLQLQHEPDNLKAYVFRAIRNSAIDRLRAESRTGEMLDDSIFDPNHAPDQAAEEKQFQQKIDAALLRLSPDERETVVQHLFAGLSHREIAEIRSVPLGTAASWYQRGLARLRDLLKE